MLSMNKKSFPLIVLLLTLIACSRTDNPQHNETLGPRLHALTEERTQGYDTIYTEAKAMSLHRTEPERALVMIDSAVIAGNISWQRGEYLRAITQYGGLRNSPLARQICLDLLATSPSDSFTLENTYTLLVTIEYGQGNYAATIHYATEASRLAHALNLPDDIGDMEGYIAHVMAETGKTDEGIQHLQATIDELRQLNSFHGVTVYHTTSKKLLHILLDNSRFAEMVPICEAMLARIDELDLHPELFSGIPDGFNTSEFIDYARGQTLAFLTTSYARQATALSTPSEQKKVLLAMANATDQEARRTQWSQTLDYDRMMTAALHHMGEFQRFDEAMDRIEATMLDTLNSNYLIGLYLRSTAAEMRGRTVEALSYLKRANVIRDSLDHRDQREQLNELATVYHLQEEQLARQQKEAEAQKTHIINIALTIGLLAAILFLAWFFWQKRVVDKKNRVLVKLISELQTQQLPDNGKEEKAKPDRELFDRIDAYIRHEHLYADLNMQRQTIIDHFGIGRHTLNQLLAEFTEEPSFTVYVNNIRIDEALRLLQQDDEKALSDIAAAVGFTPSNLRQQFKKRYGITPTEYKKNR